MNESRSELYFDGIDLNLEVSSCNEEKIKSDGLLIEGTYPNQIVLVNGKFAARTNWDGVTEKIGLPEKYGRIKSVDFRQAIALDQFLCEGISLSVCLGKAGTGKTYLALGVALTQLSANKIDKVYFIKPMVGVSRSKFLGTLPGGIEEKTAPFIDSFRDVARSLGMENKLDIYIEENMIEFIPIDFIRGRNLDHCLLIFDEGQNLDKHALLAVLTRIGKNAKAIVLGDANPEQNDLKGESGLQKLLSSEKFWKSEYTSCTHLKKRMRDPIVELVEEILLEDECESRFERELRRG